MNTDRNIINFNIHYITFAHRAAQFMMAYTHMQMCTVPMTAPKQITDMTYVYILLYYHGIWWLF